MLACVCVASAALAQTDASKRKQRNVAAVLASAAAKKWKMENAESKGGAKRSGRYSSRGKTGKADKRRSPSRPFVLINDKDDQTLPVGYKGGIYTYTLAFNVDTDDLVWSWTTDGGDFAEVIEAPEWCDLKIESETKFTIAIEESKVSYDRIVNLVLAAKGRNGEEQASATLCISQSGNPEVQMKSMLIIHEFSNSGLVDVKGGSFKMGGDKDAPDNEKPQHKVTLANFKIGKTEVTQELWYAVMQSNPSLHKGDRLPVQNVSYNDCMLFIDKLNALTGKKFRLPTEAEWEYVANKGRTPKNPFKRAAKKVASAITHNEGDSLPAVAWYSENAQSAPHSVGEKKANEYGVYDMLGNVAEWCSDWYGPYSKENQKNPTGPVKGERKVLRGGSWLSGEKECGVTNRADAAPGAAYSTTGFRLVLDP